MDCVARAPRSPYLNQYLAAATAAASISQGCAVNLFRCLPYSQLHGCTALKHNPVSGSQYASQSPLL